MPPLVISAKDLGGFATERGCPRCLWVGLHVKRLPYQIFPGIFSSIDAYNKRVVNGYFDREGQLPVWLSRLGEVKAYVPPPPYQRFSVQDPATGVTLRGTADGIFQMRDGSYTIVDYKTARYTPNQEALLPVYIAQLNGYAYIANRLELGPVSQLALVYMEPVTDPASAAAPEHVDSRGFSMALSATVVSVPLDPDGMIPRLLARAKALYDLAHPPQVTPGCQDCEAVQALATVWR
jgi:hypothetical protein